MSRRLPTEVEQLGLGLTCRKCNRKQDEWCTTTGGHNANMLHAVRIRDARAALGENVRMLRRGQPR